MKRQTIVHPSGEMVTNRAKYAMLKYFIPLLLVATGSLADTAVEHSTRPEHEWFAQQYSTNGASCCGLADGHILEDEEWKNLGDHYEVKIHGKWFVIDPRQMRDVKPDNSGSEPLRGVPSPVGKATVWYKYYNDIQIKNNTPALYCFSPYEFMQ